VPGLARKEPGMEQHERADKGRGEPAKHYLGIVPPRPAAADEAMIAPADT
jgi:hypothetical protein